MLKRLTPALERSALGCSTLRAATVAVSSARATALPRGCAQYAHVFAKRASWGIAYGAFHWEYPLSCHLLGGGQWSLREHQHDLQTMLMTYPNQAGSL